jgi:hypothetical protein
LAQPPRKDTINAALREISDRRRRAAAIKRMRSMVAEDSVSPDLVDDSDDGDPPTKNPA